ncbi:MAG: DUF3800 domain-containing protein [Candidatus Eiseniibacteriota bacterium]
MHFAYVDESGDDGPNGSVSFCLACVLVEASKWTAALDGLLDQRRVLRDRHGMPIRPELKASHFVHNDGPFRNLSVSESGRTAIYRSFMRLHDALGLRCFAVLIRKHGEAEPVNDSETLAS